MEIIHIMISRFKVRFLLLLMLSLCINACGFHLRTIKELPSWVHTIALDFKGNNKEFEMQLRALLENYHIRIVDNPKQASLWLIIHNNAVAQKMVSVGASTNPRQYQLIMTTEFSAQTPNNQVIKPLQRITVSRQLTINNDRILGSNEEEHVLISEMYKSTTTQILNRLSSP